jgi:hypothetical protein
LGGRPRAVPQLQQRRPAVQGSLLPGASRKVKATIYAGNDNYCSADISYRITYTLRQFPNL